MLPKEKTKFGGSKRRFEADFSVELSKDCDMHTYVTNKFSRNTITAKMALSSVGSVSVAVPDSHHSIKYTRGATTIGSPVL